MFSHAVEELEVVSIEQGVRQADRLVGVNLDQRDRVLENFFLKQLELVSLCGVLTSILYPPFQHHELLEDPCEPILHLDSDEG